MDSGLFWIINLYWYIDITWNWYIQISSACVMFAKLWSVKLSGQLNESDIKYMFSFPGGIKQVVYNKLQKITKEEELKVEIKSNQ